MALDLPGLSRGVLGQGGDYIATVRGEVERRTGFPGAHLPAGRQPRPLHAPDHGHRRSGGGVPRGLRLAGAAGGADRGGGGPGLGRAVPPGAAAGNHLGLCPGVAWNRRILTRDGRLVRLAARPPDDQVLKEPRDDRVPLLLVSDATSLPGDPGHWRGALMGFTCHPTTVQVQPLVSADYPGVACATVERELEAEACLFCRGPAGTWALCGRRPASGTWPLTGGPWEARPCAASPAQAPDVPPMSPALAIASEMVEDPLLAPAGRPAASALRAVKLQHEIRDAPDDAARREAIAAYRRVAEPLRLAQLGAGPVRLEVQALRLGEGPGSWPARGNCSVEYGAPPQGSPPRGFDLRSPPTATATRATSPPRPPGTRGLRGLPRPLDAGGAGGGGTSSTERAISLARRVWAGAPDRPRA